MGVRVWLAWCAVPALAGVAIGATVTVGASPADPAPVPAAAATTTATTTDERTFLTTTSEVGDYVGGGLEWVFSPHGERFSSRRGGGFVPEDRGGVTVDVEVEQSVVTVTLAPPAGERLRTGVVYTVPATRSQDPAQLAASGFSRTCNVASGSFVLHQLDLDAGGVPSRLDLTFEQTCLDARAQYPLRGRLSYRATTSSGPHAEAWARAGRDLRARLGRAPTADERYTEAERLLAPSPIRTRWRFLGGESGLALLGPATGPEVAAGDGRGRVQPHRSGVIAWSPATGAHEVRGAIHDVWARSGGVRSPLGYPTSDELDTADARGRWNTFERGYVVWSPSTGAHEIRGAIAGAWSRLGRDRSALGLPTTGELVNADGVGRRSHFQDGVVHWSPGSGAHEVRGAVLARWSALGAERGRLGYPVSDEHDVPGGRASDFQRGTVTWTRATGGVTVTLR